MKTPSRITSEMRLRFVAEAASRARSLRRSAARSTTAWGWLASWDSAAYFALPVIFGAVLAPVVVLNLSRGLGATIALMLALWPIGALAAGSLASSLGERRERAWVASLPFTLEGHRRALAGVRSPTAVVVAFVERADAARLAAALRTAGLGDLETTVGHRVARVALPPGDARARGHDQRAYHVALHRLVDRALLPLADSNAIERVLVA